MASWVSVRVRATSSSRDDVDRAGNLVDRLRRARAGDDDLLDALHWSGLVLRLRSPVCREYADRACETTQRCTQCLAHDVASPIRRLWEAIYEVGPVNELEPAPRFVQSRSFCWVTRRCSAGVQRPKFLGFRLTLQLSCSSTVTNRSRTLARDQITPMRRGTDSSGSGTAPASGPPARAAPNPARARRRARDRPSPQSH